MNAGGRATQEQLPKEGLFGPPSLMLRRSRVFHTRVEPD